MCVFVCVFVATDKCWSTFLLVVVTTGPLAVGAVVMVTVVAVVAAPTDAVGVVVRIVLCPAAGTVARPTVAVIARKRDRKRKTDTQGNRESE